MSEMPRSAFVNLVEVYFVHFKNRSFCRDSSNKCHASSNKCLTSSNKKLVELNYPTKGNTTTEALDWLRRQSSTEDGLA